MKKSTFLAAALLGLSIIMSGQAPETSNYQAVVQDQNGDVLAMGDPDATKVNGDLSAFSEIDWSAGNTQLYIDNLEARLSPLENQ